MEADGGAPCIATLMPKPTTVTAADGRGGLGTAIERPDEGGEGGNEDTTRFGTGALGRELGLGTLATGGRDSGGGAQPVAGFPTGIHLVQTRRTC